MIKYSLALLLVLTCSNFGQSIQDLMEQAGALPQEELVQLQAQAETPGGPSEIKSELPEKEIVKILPTPVDTATVKNYGYDYFSSKNELIMLDNLPAPPSYLLGPGDEIIVTIWGETELRETNTISRDGNIYFENIGLINLVGLSFTEAKRTLKSRFESVYSTLRGGSDATTFIEISLGALKSINIHFLGEVNSPGVIPIHPFSTITTGLIQAGGVSLIGSLRDIRVIRNGKLIRSIDYYQYIQNGTLVNNIRLVDNDVISIPIRKSAIQIKGKVRRAGIFELKQGETLNDLIHFAGGLENDAGAKAEIKRVLPLKYRKSGSNDIQHIWVELSRDEEIELVDGDKVTVFPLFVTDQNVHVEGQVKNPGDFSLSADMKVLDLLELSGGIFMPDYWSTVYPFRADLIRIDKYESTSQILPIRLDSLKQGSTKQNYTLQDGDRLIIYPAGINKYAKTVEIFGDIRKPGEYELDDNMGLTDLILRAGGFSYSAYPAEVTVNSIDPFNVYAGDLSTELKVKIDPTLFNEYPVLDKYKLKNKDQVFIRKFPEFQFQRNVTIEGEVKFPGVYALEEKGEKLGNIIERAGDLTEESFLEGLKVLRNEKRLILGRRGRSKVNLDLSLLPGDKVFIPKHPNTVEVIGEVNSPGLIQYKRGLSVKDYIKIAGNYTQAGEKSSVAVYYPNGESKNRVYYFFDPKVREGSKIIVYAKPEALLLDKTAFLTEVTTILIQSLSLLLVAEKLAK